MERDEKLFVFIGVPIAAILAAIVMGYLSHPPGPIAAPSAEPMVSSVNFYAEAYSQSVESTTDRSAQESIRLRIRSHMDMVFATHGHAKRVCHDCDPTFQCTGSILLDSGIASVNVWAGILDLQAEMYSFYVSGARFGCDEIATSMVVRKWRYAGARKTLCRVTSGPLARYWLTVESYDDGTLVKLVNDAMLRVRPDVAREHSEVSGDSAKRNTPVDW